MLTKRWIVQKKTMYSFGWFDTARYRWFIQAAFYAASLNNEYTKYRVVDSRTYDYDAESDDNFTGSNPLQ